MYLFVFMYKRPHTRTPFTTTFYGILYIYLCVVNWMQQSWILSHRFLNSVCTIDEQLWLSRKLNKTTRFCPASFNIPTAIYLHRFMSANLYKLLLFFFWTHDLTHRISIQLRFSIKLWRWRFCDESYCMNLTSEYRVALVSV